MYDTYGDYVGAFLLFGGLHVLGTAIPGCLLVWRKRRRKLKEQNDLQRKTDQGFTDKDQDLVTKDQAPADMDKVDGSVEELEETALQAKV